MQATSYRPSVISISGQTIFGFSRNFVSVLYQKRGVLTKRAFRENRSCDSNALLKGVKKFLPFLPCFLTDFSLIRLKEIST